MATFQETMAKIEADAKQIRDNAMAVFNPDINRSSIQPYIDSDRLRGKSDWDRECQESRRLNR